MKKGAVIRVSETFTIRKIDPRAIASKFFKGEYANRTLPESKIKNSNVIVNIGKEIGNDASSEIYRFKDKNNNNINIYTTNHALYKYYIQDLNNKLDFPILKCKYCKRGNLKRPIGLPVSMTLEKGEKMFGITPENVTFHVVDSFCDFGCAFSYLKRKIGESRMYREPFYANAEQLLYCLYYRVYPDRLGMSIKEKPDWDLLRENGGPLTNEEFDCEN